MIWIFLAVALVLFTLNPGFRKWTAYLAGAALVLIILVFGLVNNAGNLRWQAEAQAHTFNPANAVLDDDGIPPLPPGFTLDEPLTH
jgi:hypothetical protein